MNILKILTPKRSLGNFGERAACKYLKKNGYKILERNYVAFNKEIDVIAARDGVTAFIEVKTRTDGVENPNEQRPASAVTPEKQRGIITAAKCYLGFNRPDTRARLDVIEVLVKNGGKRRRVVEIKHLKGAFNLNTAHRRK
ncbi:MAG: YraN family protein [Clostridia bacterium]|nr:YraN family protein [Clostridia bacterium]